MFLRLHCVYNTQLVQEQKKKLADVAAAAQHSADAQSNSTTTESDATSDAAADAAAEVTHTMLFGTSSSSGNSGGASSGTTLVLRELAIDRPDTPFAGSDGSCEGMLVVHCCNKCMQCLCLSYSNSHIVQCCANLCSPLPLPYKDALHQLHLVLSHIQQQ
jgi:hypothetical protein